MDNKTIQVKLAEYKGIEVRKREVTVTEQEILSEMERARTYASTTEDKSDGSAVMGDQAVIDFVGYIDDTPFEGGDGQDFPLTLGSNTFIPGFEEQLDGAKVGDQVDVRVSFPENYHAKEYAGREAVFKVTVKSLRATLVPELSDEVVARISPCRTVEEFRGYVEKQIRDYKADQILQEKENEALT
ncbi:MAG: FKBP-type peptidyl-prolyl cis-trans isomerase [Clostridiales bacterium]|nr:FKBP-type peptidyl-prolyl cis-trans isomerase [Clostridiales bacterium]